MNQRWLAKRSQRPVAPRVRDRKNKYGRRGPGNRCGHDRRHFIRPTIRRNLPPFILWQIEAFLARPLPSQLVFRFQSRSERDEVMRALVPVMLESTYLLTQQIGQPNKRTGAIDGLTVDRHLAPRAGISESRVERGIKTLKDWGWHKFHIDAAGRRCASQQVEETETGELRGRAAIRVWNTSQFLRDIGMSEAALRQAQALYAANLKKRPTDVPLAPLVSRLVEDLGLPREKPPP